MSTAITVASSTLASAVAAANAAANGSKDAAYIDSLIAQLGTSIRHRVIWNSVEVFNSTVAGPAARSGTQLFIPGVTAAALAAAAFATGSGVHRIENASNAAVFIQSPIGQATGTTPARVSKDFASGQPATIAQSVFNGPGFDTVTSGVGDMIAHMAPNTVILPGARDLNFMKGGCVIQGADLRSVAVPSWWPGNKRTGEREYWSALQPWYVIWDESGHQGDLNVRLEVSNLQLWVLADGASSWTMLSDTLGPWGDPFSRDIVTSGGDASRRYEANGRLSVRINPDGSVFHGYQGQVASPAFNPATLRGVHVRIFARLVKHDASGPDQFSAARYCLQAGLDIYPFGGASNSDTGMSSGPYWPGSIGGRYMPIRSSTTREWASATNIITARNVDGSAPYNSRHTLTESAFRALPPPLPVLTA
ncbi:MAG TPA: hypothetical protein VEA81_12765 [Burkholderiaceae bacterium]|nr:hypothetical protein [Burkholderiaceae bacterium]